MEHILKGIIMTQVWDFSNVDIKVIDHSKTNVTCLAYWQAK